MALNDTKITGRVHVTELVTQMQNFQLVDYIILIVMLSMSAIIGLYFGFKEKQKNRNTKSGRRNSAEQEYLVGGRKLQIFPVAMSLAASWVSGIAIMGMSSEVYVFGTQFAFYLIAIIVGTSVVHYIFIPVFHDLKITSSFEYLEARFDKKLRLLSAAIFIITVIIWLPLVFFATALAFNQMTGISIHLITLTTCSICIFYTCMGGIKAVVWTDVIQTVFMYGTLLTVVVKGLWELGLIAVWERNLASGRIELPEMSLDPTVRHSMPSVLIGGLFFWTYSISSTQMFVQRYVSLATVNAARKALWIFAFTVASLLGMCYICGMLAYAKYHDCDPMTTKLAKSKDQILSVLVVDLFKNVPGVPGLFVAGIFSAALSSLSTALNALAAVVLEDFFKQIMNTRPSVRMTSYIMRSTVLISGVICVGLVFVVEKLGSILQLAMTVNGSTGGPMFAIYVMGLLMPRINAKSAFIGGGCGLVFMIYVVVRAQLDQLAGKITFVPKPVAANNCPYEFDAIIDSATNASTTISGDPISRQIHHISYLFYILLGMAVTMATSTLASFFVKHDANEVRPDLLAPFIRKTVNDYKVPDNQKLESLHHFEDIELNNYINVSDKSNK